MSSLSPNKLNSLLVKCGRVSPALELLAHQKLDQSIELLKRNLKLKAGRDITINRPELRFDLQGRTAGYAFSPNHRNSPNTIQLNSYFLTNPDTQQDMLNVTLPHELAHIACYQIFPNDHDHHGPRWQLMMKYLELPPDRCHNYDTTEATARKHTKYPTVCTSCNATVLIGSARLRRLRSGKTYIHTNCGGLLKEPA